MCEAVTTRSGGLATTGIAGLNQALRRTINSARGYQPPIELIAQRLNTHGITSRLEAWRGRRGAHRKPV